MKKAVYHSAAPCSAIIATTFGVAAPAAAQDAAGQDYDAILVTARRTQEHLQDVPVAVAAFDRAALMERRINSEVDLQIATPGLTVRQTGSSDHLNYAIRGRDPSVMRT